MTLPVGFMGKLYEKFLENDGYFEVRGAKMGASFIAWLLNATNVNPLEPHYYCPQCKKIEFATGAKCGIDLPDKQCTCGNKYNKDGFGINEMNIYPLEINNEINVSLNGTEIVRECLHEYFSEYGEIKEVKVIADADSDGGIAEYISIRRFAVITKEMEKRYKDKVIEVPLNDYLMVRNELGVLTVIEDEYETAKLSVMKDIEFTPGQIEVYYKYALENKTFKKFDYKVDLGKIISDIKQPKFSDLVAMYGFMHGTGAWEGNAEYLYDKGISLDEMICCREEVYSYLYNKLKGKECENPYGAAFVMMENVRKGIYARGKMPAEVEERLMKNNVPEWYIDSMKKVYYLFPKTYLVTMLKREMCRRYAEARIIINQLVYDI